MRDYALFLRGISNVPMEPFRAALSELGLTHVASFGASGNFVFCAPYAGAGALERRIAEALDVVAFVRTRADLAKIVAEDPYRDRPGASVFLAERRLGEAQRRRLGEIDFEGESPVVSGATVYFVHPTRRLERRAVVDFERELGVRGTMRGSRVVGRVLALMQAK